MGNSERALPPDHGTTINALRSLLENQDELEVRIRRYPVELEVTIPGYYRVVLDHRSGQGPLDEIRRLMKSIPYDQPKGSE